MPKPVIEAIENHIRLEASLGGYEAADHQEEEINRFYESAAKLLNGKASNIAFTSSATNSYARALSCIPFEKGDKVLSAHPFPIAEGVTGWVLLVFDRTEAISIARADARTQLGWMASAALATGRNGRCYLRCAPSSRRMERAGLRT